MRRPFEVEVEVEVEVAENAMTKSRALSERALGEVEDVLDELDILLKNADVGAELAEAGVNVSLALTLADGLRAYLHGDKEKAILELGTATDEIAARMVRGRGGEPS